MNLCQDAFVLHRRAYRNTSLLVDFFTREQGIVRCVARAGRGTNQSALFAPFQSLWISYQAGRDLANLHKIEVQSLIPPLIGNKLYCGFYLNELLNRLLIRHDPQPEIFHAYHQALEALSQANFLESILRRFELYLLQCLGYGLSLDVDAASGSLIVEGETYRFIAKSGFIKLDENAKSRHNPREIFNAEQIIAINNDLLDDSTTLAAAKRLMRLAIDDLLEGKPLLSRELFNKDIKK